jgi:hypothetical protein
MSLANALNLLGLALIAIGGIGAAVCAPSPQYNADGSVSLSGVTDKDARIAIHRRQKWFRPLLFLAGVGALLQGAAIYMAP